MRRLFPVFVDDPGALGLLILRLVAGFGLMVHGYPKLVHGFTWMLSLYPSTHIPGYIQVLSPVAEFCGGLALLLGFLTPIACLGIIGDMGFALFYVHFAHGDPFIVPIGSVGTSYESALMYLSIAVMYLLVGPGVHSLDAVFFNRPNIPSHRQNKVAAWR